MRGRSSSKQGRIISRVRVTMENNKVDKVKQEPHLSGAYIRSLVKHLTTSTRTKDGNGELPQTLNTNGECFGGDRNDMQQESTPPPPPQHKKQVRRRQHTSRPYQERLLNMAEARREIVTALKFHRASMKQQEVANNHDVNSSKIHPQFEHSQSQSQSPPPPPAAAATNYLEHYSGLYSPPSLPYYWPISTSTLSPPPLPPLHYENIDFTLPKQPLGLNLNFQDFKNLDANLYHNPLSSFSSSSSSSSSSSFTSTSSSAAVSVSNSSGDFVVNGGSEVSGSDLHHAMDDDEIEEIRSLGEQHQMEWNDTVNLMMSARWFKFLKTIEIGSEDGKFDSEFNPFDQVMEFPPWLINANESSILQQRFDDYFCDDYFQDPALSCMDIGELEGMDGEWLA